MSTTIISVIDFRRNGQIDLREFVAGFSVLYRGEWGIIITTIVIVSVIVSVLAFVLLC